MRQIAIIGPTASGKTSLAIDVAMKTQSVILSLDSLSVYKEIDIASAKPTIQERQGIVHFGIDEVYPNEKFDVTLFFECYKSAKEYALMHNKNLVIVGGSGFYLKALIDGISPNINPSQDDMQWVRERLSDLDDAYNFLQSIDASYAKKIYATDKYRIEKALSIYKATSLPPTLFFEKNPKVGLIQNITIFEIIWDKDVLRKRIALRTKEMLQNNLIHEVEYLVDKYGKNQSPFNSIGIKETLEFLDNTINLQTLEELITTHTAQLAKKQRTFNKSQFPVKISDTLDNLKKEIFKHF